MSGVEIALLAASAAMSAVGAISAGNAASDQAKAAASAADFNRKVSERNQVIAGQKRQLILQQARVDAEDLRRDNARRQAEIRASYGASGLQLAGSPLDVLEDTALELETDVRRTEHQGQVAGYESALQILGMQDDAMLSGFERDSALRRAKSAKTAGMINAGGALLSGASGVAGSDYAKQNWWQ